MVRVIIENDCVNCSEGCIDCGRKQMKVPYFYCDRCGGEHEELYMVDNVQFCKECLLDNAEKVTVENWADYV